MDPGLFSAARKAGSDGQIIVWDSPGTKVYQNTILTNGNTSNSIQVRWTATGTEVRNNLVDAPIGAREGADFASRTSGNYLGATSGMFVAPRKGDLHLVANSATLAYVIDKVSRLADVPTDWDVLQTRPIGANADIGADEYTAPLSTPRRGVARTTSGRS